MSFDFEVIYSERNSFNSLSINHIKKISDDSIGEIPNDYVDFVYIDGLHTYEQVKTEIDKL